VSAVAEIGKASCHSFNVINRPPAHLSLPAICLWRPKNTSNIGGALRAAGAFDIDQVWAVNMRPKLNPRHIKYRHPSMTRNIPDPVELVLMNEHELLDLPYPKIGVELVERAIPLSVFQHPIDAIYIFGPEDGSVPKYVLEECKETVQITTRFCLNLASSVNVVLYDRSTKVVTP
jgi:tRNA(Leu) C34 or U34 (ribose-2'-O)-methylase TrmL